MPMTRGASKPGVRAMLPSRTPMLTARGLLARETGHGWIGRAVRAVRETLLRWADRTEPVPADVVASPRLPAPVEQRDAGRLLDRVGAEWTLAEWMRRQTGVDLPGLIRLRILGESAEWETGQVRRLTGGREEVQRGLAGLGVMPDLWDGYLGCLCTQYEGLLSVMPDLSLTFFEFCSRWVTHERTLLEAMAPRFLKTPGRLDAIRRALRTGSPAALKGAR